MFEMIKQLLEQDWQSTPQEKVFNATIIKDAKLKDGRSLNKGEHVRCVFDPLRTSSFTVVLPDGTEFKSSYKNAHMVLSKFKKEPSINSLQKMSNNGIATTPLGNRTEPDGHGEYGEPSWLLVLGLI